MENISSKQTIRQFTAHVGEQQHAMAGAVIAASAGQAAALGAACMRISLERWGDNLNAADVTERIDHMQHVIDSLLDWCDQDATAIADFVALREAGKELAGQQLLCRAPAEVSRLSIEAAKVLKGFRPLVHQQVQDDLEMAFTLLAGTAQAAMLLLDSNLRHWPNHDLLQEFDPTLHNLLREIHALSPVARIR